VLAIRAASCSTAPAVSGSARSQSFSLARATTQRCDGECGVELVLGRLQRIARHELNVARQRHSRTHETAPVGAIEKLVDAVAERCFRDVGVVAADRIATLVFDFVVGQSGAAQDVAGRFWALERRRRAENRKQALVAVFSQRLRARGPVAHDDPLCAQRTIGCHFPREVSDGSVVVGRLPQRTDQRLDCRRGGGVALLVPCFALPGELGEVGVDPFHRHIVAACQFLGRPRLDAIAIEQHEVGRVGDDDVVATGEMSREKQPGMSRIKGCGGPLVLYLLECLQ